MAGVGLTGLGIEGRCRARVGSCHHCCCCWWEGEVSGSWRRVSNPCTTIRICLHCRHQFPVPNWSGADPGDGLAVPGLQHYHLPTSRALRIAIAVFLECLELSRWPVMPSWISSNWRAAESVSSGCQRFSYWALYTFLARTFYDVVLGGHCVYFGCGPGSPTPVATGDAYLSPLPPNTLWRCPAGWRQNVQFPWVED